MGFGQLFLPWTLYVLYIQLSSFLVNSSELFPSQSESPPSHQTNPNDRTQTQESSTQDLLLSKPLEISSLFSNRSPGGSGGGPLNNLTDDELRSLLLSQPQKQFSYSGSGEMSQCDPMTNVYPCGSLEFIGCAGNKKYYAESIIRLNWYEAWEYCRTHGMHLASIETRYEQTFLEVFLPRPELVEKPSYWLSGTDFGREGLFIWMANGRSFTYTNWQRAEPNNRQGREHCVQMEAVGHSWNWNDQKCSSNALAICQKEYNHNLEETRVHQFQQSNLLNNRPQSVSQKDDPIPVQSSFRPEAPVFEGVPHNLKKKKNTNNKRKRTKPKELTITE